jgi:proline iminopeptidase
VSDAFLDDAIHLIREGADLYLEQVGPADAPAVLFLHGGPGASSHAFRELLGEDLEAYRMIYLDQRGGGRSYADAGFDLDTLADDAAAVVAALRPRPGDRPGPRLRRGRRRPARRTPPGPAAGPRVAQPLAVDAAPRRTLHRRAGVGRVDAEDDGADPVALVDAAFAAVGAKPLFDALLFPDPAARLRLEHAESTVLLGPSESAGLDDPWHVDVSDELERCQGPVAVLLATGDRSCYPDQAELALARLPHALTALLGGGHHPYLDDPSPSCGPSVGPGARWGANVKALASRVGGDATVGECSHPTYTCFGRRSRPGVAAGAWREGCADRRRRHPRARR